MAFATAAAVTQKSNIGIAMRSDRYQNS